MVPERLVTERLVLRRFHRRDVDALTEAVRSSLPELAEFLPWANRGYGRDEASNYIRESVESWREGRAFDYAIRRPARPDHHVGNASIWHVSRQGRSGEIGYWVRTDSSSQGIATEAAARLIRLAFDRLAMHKVTLRIAVGNRASERVAEKLGFTKEGVMREELLIGGRWVDHTLFSILEREWRTVRSPASG